MPRVTVIIATYNWSTVLPYSVGSVLRQTFTDWDLWVVGDGCTDDTAEVMARFEDPRVKFHNLPENARDQAVPNQWGLEHSDSEYVCYLNHDDLYMPHAIEAYLASVRDDAPGVSGIGVMIMVDGTYRLTSTCAGGYQARPADWATPSCMFHRREAALEVGGWVPLRVSNKVPMMMLWRGLVERYGPFAPCHRLVCVKFPAATRKGVYKTRPCHEQQEYTKRIETEPDFEARHLGFLLEAYSQPKPLPPPKLDPVERVWKGLKRRLLPRPKKQPTPFGLEHMKWALKNKGVED